MKKDSKTPAFTPVTSEEMKKMVAGQPRVPAPCEMRVQCNNGKWLYCYAQEGQCVVTGIEGSGSGGSGFLVNGILCGHDMMYCGSGANRQSEGPEGLIDGNKL